MVLRIVLALIDTNHAFRDAELIHFAQRVNGVIVVFAHLRELLEHIFSGHLKLLPTLLVHQQRTNKIIIVRRIIVRDRHHQIDDPDIAWHGHNAVSRSVASNTSA